MVNIMDWRPINTAPFDREVELAIIDRQGEHALIFPCRRIVGGWVDARTKKQLYYILPTHWRDWLSSPMPPTSTTLQHFRNSSDGVAKAHGNPL